MIIRVYRITRLVFLSETVCYEERTEFFFNVIQTYFVLLSHHKTQPFCSFPLLRSASSPLPITLSSSLTSAFTLFSVLSYQKDERSLPDSLQNRKLFLISPIIIIIIIIIIIMLYCLTLQPFLSTCFFFCLSSMLCLAALNA